MQGVGPGERKDEPERVLERIASKSGEMAASSARAFAATLPAGERAPFWCVLNRVFGGPIAISPKEPSEEPER